MSIIVASLIQSAQLHRLDTGEAIYGIWYDGGSGIRRTFTD